MSRPGQWPSPPEPLPVPVVDNHCHLEYPAGDEPRTVLERLDEAHRAGVTRVVQIGCDLEAAHWTAQQVLTDRRMVGGVALHPTDAAELKASGDYDDAFAQIVALGGAERIRVIGETGLDHHHTGPEGWDAQVEAFRDHIALAKELGLPLQVHDRDAHGLVVEVLTRDGAPEGTVMHCFSGDAAFARECVARGWYLSFAGNLTFRNAHSLRAALAVTPAAQVLLETDSPFLTPHPWRGRPNSPAQVAVTARVAAEVLAVPVEELCTQVWRTSHDLYGPW